ncbi:hypothetical protein CONCODRAFT_12723 [Conidiobolus coronatus NRRL 28638]|uniref:RNI-like protein n=1 Tax=Conidiobolus coronatus (strain ATCC 28846 / CBS 209.66 / NRRL 28638) TaxID=796925 RepID=A0A137NS78_CONC2|nr:hypothetical protein CONCODRAFT_12723 [Conidiobolus coronatus NRRL 28638]|eukprot:KXN65619.1 hypothetical protein CONCODRAFT_12723 [Conidiobolus coronatus NRRL 28638]
MTRVLRSAAKKSKKVKTYLQNRKDLIKFNTVCKKWNNLTNPIIHKTIKLDSRWDAEWQWKYKKDNNAAKINADVVECISNNAKHAHLVKEFKFNYKLNPQRAVEVFETFRSVRILTIEECDMSQDQFLGMISPLTQLQELTLSYLTIKNIIKKKTYKEAVQLPSSLKKLKLLYIILTNNPELFVQTINSHSNLVEFNTNSYPTMEFLEPFYKPYPSLLNFELDSDQPQTPLSLFTILEQNPQLASLKLSLEHWSSELVSHISTSLINLEELKLSRNEDCVTEDSEFFVKFSQPTKIKKLNLDWARLSNCSLNSILINCPHLEELDLNPCTYYKQPNSVEFLNLSNSPKLRKLAIDCDALGDGIFASVLLNSRNLNELSISLPSEWKKALKTIYEKCRKLEKLNILPPLRIHMLESDTLSQEFYETELFASNSKCKSTLMHITFIEFNVADFKAEYFKNFENLKSIKFPDQSKVSYDSLNPETEIDMGLWPGYRLLTTNIKDTIYDAELKRI